MLQGLRPKERRRLALEPPSRRKLPPINSSVGVYLDAGEEELGGSEDE